MWPTKSSQNVCPKSIRGLLDQSYLPREVMLQLNMCRPSEMQHSSVYIPVPSQCSEPEQCPKDHLKSDAGLYIETSKHFDVWLAVKTSIKLGTHPNSSWSYLVHCSSHIVSPYHIVSFCTCNLYQILMSQSRFLEAWMVHFYHKKVHRSRYILSRLSRPPLHPPKARAGWKC